MVTDLCIVVLEDGICVVSLKWYQYMFSSAVNIGYPLECVRDLSFDQKSASTPNVYDILQVRANSLFYEKLSKLPEVQVSTPHHPYVCSISNDPYPLQATCSTPLLDLYPRWP